MNRLVDWFWACGKLIIILILIFVTWDKKIDYKRIRISYIEWQAILKKEKKDKAYKLRLIISKPSNQSAIFKNSASDKYKFM